MIEDLKKEIPFLNTCSKIELINKGLSYASVYRLECDNCEYVLKVYKDNNINRESIVKKYLDTNQPIPKILKYGKTKNFGFYIIMEYIRVGTLEDNYNRFSENEIFLKAKVLGEKHKSLIQKYSHDAFDFHEKFINSEFEKYDKTVELIQKYQDVLPLIDVLKIKEDMERLIVYFKEDHPLYMHWDLKADNILASDEFLMIDYEGGEVLYLPIALRCEIYHIMNNDDNSLKSRSFLKGIITGIDESQLLDPNLNKKLAYAYLKSAFVYIIGYLLNNQRVDDAVNQIKKINDVYSKCEKIEELIYKVGEIYE